VSDISSDPFMTQPWPWHMHVEICKKFVSEDGAAIIRDILEGNKVEKLILGTTKTLMIMDEDPNVTDYTFVTREFAGEWRWGTTYEVIIKENATGKLWGTTYQEQIGDHYYNSLEDGDSVHFYPVEAVEKTVVEYRRIKNAK